MTGSIFSIKRQISKAWGFVGQSLPFWPEPYVNETAVFQQNFILLHTKI